jgi:hypothetical protein
MAIFQLTSGLTPEMYKGSVETYKSGSTLTTKRTKKKLKSRLVKIKLDGQKELFHFEKFQPPHFNLGSTSSGQLEWVIHDETMI